MEDGGMMTGRERTIVFFVILSFVVSRVVFHLLGVRFDADTLGFYWQFIDPALLKGDLLRSIICLHSQPPLFNLFLSIVLKLSGSHYVTVFHGAYLLFGLVFYVSLAVLMMKMKVEPRVSAVLVCVFMVSPTAICYENWLYYTYPVAALLSVSGFLLYYYVRTHNVLYGFLFFSTLAALVMTWGLFHPLWFAGIGLLIFTVGHIRKRFMVSFIFPALLLAALLLKNFVLFGTTSTSSWLGMNIAHVSTFVLDINEREELVSRGKLSPLALVLRFSPAEVYRGIIPDSPPTGIPVLDDVHKSNGYNNYNHKIYIPVSNLYLRDAIYVIRHYPAVYVNGIKASWAVFFQPATYNALLRNAKYINGYRDAVSKLFHPGAVALVMLALFAFGVYRMKVSHGADSVVLMYLLVTIVYIAVVSNGIERGDNYRYRHAVDAQFLILLGIGISKGLSTVARIGRR